MAEKSKGILHKLNNGYKNIAVMSANTVVLFILINVIALVYLKACTSATDPVSQRYGDEKVYRVYPDRDKAEVQALLRETWSRPYTYQPFTQFKERAYSGTFVNVTEQGYRVIKNQAPWPPQADNFNLFVFGGSTCFGYGVADDESIPSYLQELLRSNKANIAVYNFGRGHYYSTQERILFEMLVADGHCPDMALFIDGLNDFYYPKDEPFLTPQFNEFVGGGGGAKKKLIEYSLRLPIAKAMLGSGDQPSAAEAEAPEDEAAKYNDWPLLDGVVSRYMRNKHLIEMQANDLGISVAFVWQPVPTYKYDDKAHHLFIGNGYDNHTYARYGYPSMAKLWQAGTLGNNFIWCADMQATKAEALYVDKVHYTAAFAREIATQIAETIQNRQLMDAAPALPDEPTDSTAHPVSMP